MRIAHLTTIDMSLALLLGTELQVDVEAGHEVFGISAPGPYVEGVEALGVTHVPVPSFTRAWSARADVAAGRELFAVLRRLRLDVLHTHTPKAGALGRVLGRVAGIPIVVNTCHGLWAQPGDAAVKRALVLGAEGIAAWFSDAELYQNADDRHALRRFVRDRKTTVVGNGVDLHRFRFDPDGRERLRHEWGVREGDVLVGAVGRLVAEKGIVELRRAAADLADEAQFVWVGPSDEDKPDAVSAGAGPIRFVGPRVDMPAVYSAFDVFALPSHREGFSRSAMEAAACGRAIVLTDIRGCREIGTHEEHLLLVPPRDAVSLSTAIGRLVRDDALRARLGAAAHDRARSTFDQRAIAAMSLSTYEVLARRKGVAGRR